MSITRCENKCSLPHAITKKSLNLEMLTTTKNSLNIIKVCIQQQNQNKLRWLHLQKMQYEKITS
jgi:hypothetical protein